MPPETSPTPAVGVFDVLAPAFAHLDAAGAATGAPLALRLALWAVLGAAVSMGLYKLLSSQRRIARRKEELAAVRRELDAFDGELADAIPLLRGLLGTALAQVVHVGVPGVLASLPLVSLLAWMSTTHGYLYPPSGTVPEIRTEPPMRASWVADRDAVAGRPHIVVATENDELIADVRVEAPVPVLHKRQWWNALLGNPGGYLPPHAAIERIQIDLPQVECLSFGPGWARGWEAVFFLPLLLASLAIKKVAGIV